MGPLHAVGCRDSKMLLAYSSVSHINLGVYGLGVISSSAYTGNILLGVRHGYVSALMFYVVGTCYVHTGTRQLYFLLGRLGGSSIITGLFSSVMVGNGGFPPFLSFWAELWLLLSACTYAQLIVVALGVYFILAFYYSVFIILHLTKCGLLVKVDLYIRLYLMAGLVVLLDLLMLVY